MSQLVSYLDYIDSAVTEDKLMFTAITSEAEGAIPAEGFHFGMGKSSLAAGIAKLQIMKYNSFGDMVAEDFLTNKGERTIGYTWQHHIEAVREGNKKRKLVYIMDDLQRIAGKSQSRNRNIQEWAEFFTTARPFFAHVIVTSPSLGSLAKCFRDIIMFEIKVPVRGTYEVQRIKTKTLFKDPLNPIKLLHYYGSAEFPKPSDRWEAWYKPWRQEENMDNFEDMIKRQKLTPTPEPKVEKVPSSAGSEAALMLNKIRWGKVQAQDELIIEIPARDGG